MDGNIALLPVPILTNEISCEKAVLRKVGYIF